MYVNIEVLLIQKRKSLKWLSKEVGCNYSSLWKCVKNETSSISFDLLEKICNALECNPNDVLVVDERGE